MNCYLNKPKVLLAFCADLFRDTLILDLMSPLIILPLHSENILCKLLKFIIFTWAISYTLIYRHNIICTYSDNNMHLYFCHKG